MHTPSYPAGDERAVRLIESAKLPPERTQRMLAVLGWAQAKATELGVELQCEYGATHIGLIVEHNQAVRLLRSGQHAGQVNLFVDAPQKTALTTAGFALGEPDGAVFKLFGWVGVDPAAGTEDGLRVAVDSALVKAVGMRKKM